MLLHTPLYLLFLLLVVALYWVLPGNSVRKLYLLLASYLFYALFDWRFLVLLVLLSVGMYLLGAAIPRSKHARQLMLLSIGLNLGLLALFKYAGFFVDSLRSVLSLWDVPLSPAISLILPVGISFYTFQGISYTTEIYRRKAEPAASFLDFALYMAFFPKLIAGPLVRPRQFLTQAAQPASPPSASVIQGALGLLLLGLFKKVVIADSLASLADVAFRAADMPPQAFDFPTPLFIQGFYLYAFQIYADFSGYTDLARASALLFGFNLPENFKQPYFSTTLTSFWNRWHMSLTAWFREYLFFPFSRWLLLATHRRLPSLSQTIANLVTMLLIGLWHGASWTYVAWGGWHGLLLSLESRLGWKPARRWTGFLSGVLTFHLVGLGWVLFRCASFTAAGRFLAGILRFEQMEWLWAFLPPVLLAAVLVFVIDMVGSGSMPMPVSRWMNVLVIAVLTLLSVLWLLELARGSDSRPFIYGQF